MLVQPSFPFTTYYGMFIMLLMHDLSLLIINYLFVLEAITVWEEDNAFVGEKADVGWFIADAFASSYLHEVRVLYKKSQMTTMIAISNWFFVHVFYKMTATIDLIFTPLI